MKDPKRAENWNQEKDEWSKKRKLDDQEEKRKRAKSLYDSFFPSIKMDQARMLSEMVTKLEDIGICPVCELQLEDKQLLVPHHDHALEGANVISICCDLCNHMFEWFKNASTNEYVDEIIERICQYLYSKDTWLFNKLKALPLPKVFTRVDRSGCERIIPDVAVKIKHFLISNGPVICTLSNVTLNSIDDFGIFSICLDHSHGSEPHEKLRGFLTDRDNRLLGFTEEAIKLGKWDETRLRIVLSKIGTLSVKREPISTEFYLIGSRQKFEEIVPLPQEVSRLPKTYEFWVKDHYECKCCSPCASFTLASSLEKHIEMVNCDVCGRRIKKLNLKQHSLIHQPQHQTILEGRQTGACKVCGKKMLQNNINAHEAKCGKTVKKFKCPKCSCEYVWKTCLTRHQKEKNHLKGE
jgi:hypothetical protein